MDAETGPVFCSKALNCHNNLHSSIIVFNICCIQHLLGVGIGATNSYMGALIGDGNAPSNKIVNICVAFY